MPARTKYIEANIQNCPVDVTLCFKIFKQKFQHNWPIWIQLFTKLNSNQVFFRRAISGKSTSAMIIDSKGNDSSLFHRIKNESTIFQPSLYSIRTLYFLSLAQIDIQQNDSKKLEGKSIRHESQSFQTPCTIQGNNNFQVPRKSTPSITNRHKGKRFVSILSNRVESTRFSTYHEQPGCYIF